MAQMTTEEWRRVDGFPDYDVSSLGRVRRSTSSKGTTVGKILKPNINKKTGYFSVMLTRNHVQKRVDIHRLVAYAFHGSPPSLLHLVAHNDGVRTNNNSNNLRWATQSENLFDMRKHGTSLSGSKNPMSKLNDSERELILRMKSEGKQVKHIANEFGISIRTVFRVVTRETGIQPC